MCQAARAGELGKRAAIKSLVLVAFSFHVQLLAESRLTPSDSVPVGFATYRQSSHPRMRRRMILEQGRVQVCHERRDRVDKGETNDRGSPCAATLLFFACVCPPTSMGFAVSESMAHPGRDPHSAGSRAAIPDPVWQRRQSATAAKNVARSGRRLFPTVNANQKIVSRSKLPIDLLSHDP